MAEIVPCFGARRLRADVTEYIVAEQQSCAARLLPLEGAPVHLSAQSTNCAARHPDWRLLCGSWRWTGRKKRTHCRELGKVRDIKPSLSKSPVPEAAKGRNTVDPTRRSVNVRGRSSSGERNDAAKIVVAILGAPDTSVCAAQKQIVRNVRRVFAGKMWAAPARVEQSVF